MKKVNLSGVRKWQRLNKYVYRPSTDVSVLVETIKAEGRANRKEEQREDSGKKLREWITIVLIAATLVAVSLQVREMIKVYEPIRKQAEAANSQADAASAQASAAQLQTEASKNMAKEAVTQANTAAKSASISEKAFTASQRAWVGPTNASINAAPARGVPVEITISYQNSGREPAQDFSARQTDWFVPNEQNVLARTAEYKRSCMNTSVAKPGVVVYPSTGFGGGYNLTNKLDGLLATDDMISGKDVIYIQGCFVYKTLGTVRHSYFCYFYKGGDTKVSNLNICQIGQDAD